jgi:hypothetical protein
MASEDIGTIYKTQIPGYEDSADIQAALKLYHYGTTTPITQESEIISNSVVGYIKALDTRLDTVENTGIGSDYGSTLPEDPQNGFIWVDSTSVIAPLVEKATWVLSDSGSLSGSSINIAELDADKFFIVLKDWSHNNSEETSKLVINFNNDAGPNYVNTGGLLSAGALYSPLFANTDTQDITISVDLANTAASLKPVSTIASTEAGQYFGYYKNTNEISSVQLSLTPTASFDGGTYEVWSYR